MSPSVRSGHRTRTETPAGSRPPASFYRRGLRIATEPGSRRRSIWIGWLALVLVMLACAPNELLLRPTPTPEPTRPPAPTFTPTPESVIGLVVVTPPSAGTPGVIIVPPGVDPSTLIPVPTATDTPTPLPTATSTETPPPTAIAIPAIPPLATPADEAPILLTPLPTPPPEEPEATPVTEALLPTPTVDRSRIVVFVPGPTPAAPAVPPTETPTPLPTPTPSATPTPFVVVPSGLVSLRAGPGVEYPLVAQLGPDLPIAIVGRNPEGTWLQICCVNAQSLWVAANHVHARNSLDAVTLVLPDSPPPPPTATPTPTDTPTVTPTPTATPYPFQVAEGPLWFPTNNELVSIWVKIFAGTGEDPHPLPGYFLRVEFRARPEGSAWDPRQNTRGEAPSNDFFDFSAPAGPAGGNRVQFNYKYEFRPPDPRQENPNTTETRLTLIDGFWRFYLTDGYGTQLSDFIQFDTLGGNPNREVFVAWTPR